jgi:hypothetical protein
LPFRLSPRFFLFSLALLKKFLSFFPFPHDDINFQIHKNFGSLKLIFGQKERNCNAPEAVFKPLHVRVGVGGGVEVCRIEAPVEEGEQRWHGQHRDHHRDPHPPDDVTGL